MLKEKTLTIGQAIRKARKSKKITQEKLAEKTGYCQNVICKWETDKQMPKITSVIDIADALGVSIDELVGRKSKLKPVGRFPFTCCPKCDRVVNQINSYCPNCGQALDWSDTE